MSWLRSHVSVWINRVWTKHMFTKYTEHCDFIMSYQFWHRRKGICSHRRLLGANHLQLMNNLSLFLFSYHEFRSVFFLWRETKTAAEYLKHLLWLTNGYLHKRVYLLQQIIAIKIGSIVRSFKYSSLGCTPLWLNP